MNSQNPMSKIDAECKLLGHIPAKRGLCGAWFCWRCLRLLPDGVQRIPAHAKTGKRKKEKRRDERSS